MNRLVLALPLLALGACTAATPLVDMNDVNPVTYQRDLDHCQFIGTSPDPVGPIVVGAIMGASVGMAAGAFATAPAAGSVSVAEGYGAAAGTVAGGGVAAAVNEGAVTPPEGVPQERVPVADCLRAKGYKVLPPPQP